MGIKASAGLLMSSLLLVGCMTSQKGNAQPTQPANNIMAQLRKEFDDCVYGSVASQIKQNPHVEPSLATEIAFQSCATEEQAIIGYGVGMGIPAYQVAPVMVAVKRQIKNTIRDIFANPTKYAFPARR